MKFHVITKLVRELPDGLGLPDWQDFITDKSVVRERLEPSVDAVMAQFGVRFWATREYRPAAPAAWNADERRHGLDRTYRLILQQEGRAPAGLVERLRALPAVEEVRGLEVGAAPLPELAGQASAIPRAADMIGLAYAKAMTRGRPDVRVAVIDTGVDADHRELRGKVVAQADFVDLTGLDTTGFIGDITGFDTLAADEVGHGSHVSGIIAARGLDMDEGVVPDCRLVAVRALATMLRDGRRFGAGLVDNINPAIKWAVDEGQADVVNLSLGIRNAGGGLPHEDVVRYALSRNVTIVAASGNDGTAERYYPGALPGVCAVGALTQDGTVASFTSYGANITCVAPGTGIYSCFANGTYATASGTSQASPFVAGAVAAMKCFARDHDVRLTNGAIFDALRRTSDKVDTRMRDQRAGYGRLNLADAFKHLAYTWNLN